MKSNCLKPGDAIGLVAPCHVATEERYAPMLEAIRQLGFSVKTGKNFYRNTYGYSATEAERAEDINAMAADDSVKLVLFGGGEGADEVLPYLDYDTIRAHPKPYASYSDGTTILNAITRKTGLVTYYGPLPGMFPDLSPYNREQFFAHFVDGSASELVPSAPWKLLCPGVAEGVLAGGYLGNAALLVDGEYFAGSAGTPSLLFLEDHEKFSPVCHVSSLLAHLEQSHFFAGVKGILFGHYAEAVPGELLERLRRLGQKHRIPVAYCDDFGHGENHAVLPIGRSAVLDANQGSLHFSE